MIELQKFINGYNLVRRQGWSKKLIKESKIDVVFEKDYEKYYKIIDVLNIDKSDLFRELYQAPYITKSDLLKRNGWNKKVFEKYNLTSDREVKNPHYKCAAPMQLFNLDIIETIEKTDEFKENAIIIQAKHKKASEAAKKAVQTKIKKSVDLFNSFKIKVKKVKNVIQRAINSYNDYQEYINAERGYYNVDFNIATIDSDKDFLDRITVNYIRHNLTSYDDHLDELYKRVGKNICYDIERKRIFQEIARVCPEYKNECIRQYDGNIFDEEENLNT